MFKLKAFSWIMGPEISNPRSLSAQNQTNNSSLRVSSFAFFSFTSTIQTSLICYHFKTKVLNMFNMFPVLFPIRYSPCSIWNLAAMIFNASSLLILGNHFHLILRRNTNSCHCEQRKKLSLTFANNVLIKLIVWLTFVLFTADTTNGRHELRDYNGGP